MNLSRRAFALGLGGAAVLSQTGRVAAAERKVTLAFTPANDFLPAFVAKEQGFFARRGIDANMQLVPISPTIPGAIRGGSVDIGAVTPPTLLQSNENGLDLVAICGGTIQSKRNATVSLVVRKDAGIRTAADLKGKIVGVPGVNSIIDVVFRKWLRDRGVDPAAVQIREVFFTSMQDQLGAKTVDAVTVLEPFRDRIVRSGTGERFSDYFGDVRDNAAFIYWCATREWAEKHPDEVKEFRGAIAEGIRFIHQNLAASRAIEVKYLKIASPVFSTYTTDLRVSDLVFYSELGRGLGLLKKQAEVGKYVYNR